MTKEGLIARLSNIVLAIQEGKDDREVVLASSVLCSLLGALEGGSIMELAELTAAYSAEQLAAVLPNQLSH